jgi:hypothetical protein
MLNSEIKMNPKFPAAWVLCPQKAQEKDPLHGNRSQERNSQLEVPCANSGIRKNLGDRDPEEIGTLYRAMGQ